MTEYFLKAHHIVKPILLQFWNPYQNLCISFKAVNVLLPLGSIFLSCSFLTCSCLASASPQASLLFTLQCPSPPPLQILLTLSCLHSESFSFCSDLPDLSPFSYFLLGFWEHYGIHNLFSDRLLCNMRIYSYIITMFLAMPFECFIKLTLR